MSSIPEDLYLQILLRLPVKSTFVCKCVCKAWFSLISDPNFAKMHLDFTPHRNISSNLMLSGLDDTDSYIINSICYDSLQPSLLEENEFVKMCYPYESSGYRVQILDSSCNGLICLVFSKDDVDGYNMEFFFCIWNPATHEYKRINKPTDRRRIVFNAIWMHAFDYDHKNNDYILVIGVDLDYARGTVYVYTIESDSWKCPITVPFRFYSLRKSGVLTNGEFHFLAHGAQGKLIVSMDISEERYIEMELPMELKVSGHWFITEAVLEGCLCVLALFRDTRTDIHADDRYPTRAEVWVMQDFGVQKSWAKRYTITNEVITSKIGAAHSLRFISSSKNGEILLTMQGKLISYDPKDGSAVELDRINSGVSYFESLVSVNSGTYVGERGQIEESIEPEEALEEKVENLFLR